MFSSSREFEFTGAARTWAVATVFCAAGAIWGLILPYVLSPHPTPGSVRSDGTVIRMEADNGMEQPVFQFTDRNGSMHEFRSGISSSRSAYRTGEHVTVMGDPADPSGVFVQDDKDFIVVLWILRVLGVVFGGIGLTVLLMKLRGIDDRVISRVGGLIGALTYAIPATLVLPGLWVAYTRRPNGLFPADATFGSNEWLLGSVFSVTGLLTLVATIVLYRYQARTGKTGWEWSWSSDKKT